jgi:anti-sigma B factor antagonist
MQDLLTIEVVPEQDYVTLRLTGEIDMYTAQSVRDAALAAMRKHAADIRIDLAGVTFLDSTGLEMLLATRRRATLEGGELQLIDPARTVVRLLEITGLNWLFNQVPSTAAGETGP